MFGLPFGSREEIVAVADVGSGSAGVAILALSPGKPAVALSSQQALLPLEDRGEKTAVAGIAQILQTAAESALKAFREKARGRAAVREIYCVIRAPWSRSKTARTHASFPEARAITSSLIGDLARQAIASDRETDWRRFLEGSVVRVELNGYPTSDPLEKRAREIDLFALVSACNPSLLEKAGASLRASFPHLTPVFRSSTRALVTVLRAIRDVGKEYLIVDVGGDGSSVIAVRDGIPVEHALVPAGMRTIIRRASPSGMPEETLSLMRMIERDQCASEACRTMQESLARGEPELARIFGEAFAPLAASQRLPDRLVLLAHPAIAPWLGVFFSRIDFTQFTTTARPFSVEALSPENLGRWVSYDAKMPLDTGLALGAALVNIEKSRG